MGANPAATPAPARRTSLEPFAEVVGEFHGRIYAFCLGLCRDPTEAGDLTQEVFLRAHRYRASFQEGRPVAPWLFRMARNLCNDHFEKRRGREISLEAGLASATEKLRRQLQSQLSVDSHAERVENRLVVRAAVERLEPRARATLELRYQQGFSIREIAEILGDKESAVKVRLLRTRRLLEATLGREVAPL